MWKASGHGGKRGSERDWRELPKHQLSTETVLSEVSTLSGGLQLGGTLAAIFAGEAWPR